jgi:glycosyltransferase involved in cell wall biosynthesis
MRIAIITDAWRPQVNGVVTTLSTTASTLESMGHDLLVVNPSEFRSLPCPTYPEIRLSLAPGRSVARRLDDFGPEHIHVATEGPLGIAARGYCVRRGLAFTTSYHTQFPQYVRARAPIPLAASYAFLRWFHGRATRTMVATQHQQLDLEDHGFGGIVRWTRGVNTELFRPGDKNFLPDKRPIWLYAGRVAVEKSVEDFLALDLPGTKYVIGDGPARGELEKRFSQAVFTGYKFGDELAAYLGAADVFVFPSRTDTFGLVMLEAMACGLPVAAYPVTGPVDVVRHGKTGVLSDNLQEAALACLDLDPGACRAQALEASWPKATQQFLGNLVPVRQEQNSSDLLDSSLN